MVVLAILGGVFLSLIGGAFPTLRAIRPQLLLFHRMEPGREKFGALAPIYGTLVTALIAMLIAVPVGFGIAFFLTEVCPRSLRRPVGIAIELLAGIPSIIYGMWGLFVLVPLMTGHVQPG